MGCSPPQLFGGAHQETRRGLKYFFNIMETTGLNESIDPEAKAHFDRLGNGTVLLARDALQDPNFRFAVVLICIYSKEGGAYGLVINRRSHMPLSEIFDGFSEMVEPREIFIGGPVQQEEIQILQITDEPVPDSRQIAPRVYLGGKWENIDQRFLFDEASTICSSGIPAGRPGSSNRKFWPGHGRYIVLTWKHCS